MVQDKGSMGFHTPSKELNDVFANIQEELFKKKADWESLNHTLTNVLNDVQRTIGPDKLNKDAVIAAINLAYIAKLGIEMTEIHERLTKVEKAVRDLQLEHK